MVIKKYISEIKNKIRIFKVSSNNTMDNLKILSLYKENKKSSIEYKILLLVHSIEKGLCLREIRYGFGKTKIENLIDLLELYRKNGYDINDYAFIEGIHILNNYIKFHKEKKYPLDNILVDKIKVLLNRQEINEDSDVAGIATYSSDELMQGSKFEFDKFISSRHSIRDFTKENISEDVICKAIKMAQKSPSACNRQPSRVYYSLSSDTNLIIDEIVPGNQGFSGCVNKYLIITSDMEAFGELEINQWYVNSGIFSTFLMLAFHSMGIGTCIFQWASIEEKDKKLRELAGIKKSEKIVLIMGIGNYPSEIKVPIALRKNTNEIKKVF